MKYLLFALVLFPGIFYGQSFGNALNFDGIDDYSSAPLPNDFLNLMINEFTVETTFHNQPTGDPQRIFVAKVNSNNFVTFLLSNTNNLYCYLLADGNFKSLGALSSLPYNTWNHIALTYVHSTQTLKIFHNGIELQTTHGGGSSNIDDNTFIFSTIPSSHLKFKGSIDEFRIWNHARTACQLLEEKNREITNLTNLFCYYKFNEGIGNGNNAGISTTQDLTNTMNVNLSSFALNGTTSNFVPSGVSYIPFTSPSFQFNVTSCDSYTWTNGTGLTYTSSTQATHNLVGQGSNGCDSVLVLNLTVNNSSATTLQETACKSFTWTNGTGATYTRDTVVQHVLQSASGCDSTITLNLTVNSIDSTVSVSGFTASANQSNASYQWIDCDNGFNAIANQTAQSFTALQSGNYAVIVSDNGCSAQSECVELHVVGLEYNNLNSVTLYPNPTQGILYLNGLKDSGELEILNIHGQIMRSIKYSSNSTIIGVEDLSPGIYFIKTDAAKPLKFIKK